MAQESKNLQMARKKLARSIAEVADYEDCIAHPEQRRGGAEFVPLWTEALAKWIARRDADAARVARLEAAQHRRENPPPKRFQDLIDELRELAADMDDKDDDENYAPGWSVTLLEAADAIEELRDGKKKAAP